MASIVPSLVRRDPSIQLIPDTTGWTYLPPDPGLEKLNEWSTRCLIKKIESGELRLQVKKQGRIRVIRVGDIAHPLVVASYYLGADGWYARWGPQGDVMRNPFDPSQSHTGKVPRWRV